MHVPLGSINSLFQSETACSRLLLNSSTLCPHIQLQLAESAPARTLPKFRKCQYVCRSIESFDRCLGLAESRNIESNLQWEKLVKGTGDSGTRPRSSIVFQVRNTTSLSMRLLDEHLLANLAF